MTQCLLEIFIHTEEHFLDDSALAELIELAKASNIKLTPCDKKESILSFDGEVKMTSDSGSFSLDWVDQLRRHMKKNYSLKSEPLAKALGVTNKQKDFKVIDCTFGTGKDAILLLSFGVEIIGMERNPHVFILALDSYRKACLDEEYSELFKSGLSLRFGMAIDEEFQSGEEMIAYFDPMYPVKKKKALPRKEMQVFKEVVGSDNDIDEVFEKLCDKFRRVVVKRPLKSDLVDSGAISFKGKTTRYDRYGL
ncbi:MAG: hypothetical protein BM556_11920 [Bacteriovorax sp. MedPE-SWde]|nr:MAG: hypothetical protein BM556_11920 [Bacteriovorax sp. MedPE-SWde]